MQKPFSIVVNDLKDKLVEDINTSGLPLLVVNQVLSAIYQECIKSQQAEENEYYESLSKGEE